MDFVEARVRLIEHLSHEVKDSRVLEAMARIPREEFVPHRSRIYAYDDKPLSIGLNQTISQPYIIALMTEALTLTGKEKVLEVGTGSGYQAAILAELASLVLTIERIPALAQTAQEVLNSLGYKNIEVYPAEEVLGWPRMAPYDAIIVTAAAPNVPEALMSQLAIDGRMVIPVGSRQVQQLFKITKKLQTNIIDNLGNCHFVPLIGHGAWDTEK